MSLYESYFAHSSWAPANSSSVPWSTASPKTDIGSKFDWSIAIYHILYHIPNYWSICQVQPKQLQCRTSFGALSSQKAFVHNHLNDLHSQSDSWIGHWCCEEHALDATFSIGIGRAVGFFEHTPGCSSHLPSHSMNSNEFQIARSTLH